MEPLYCAIQEILSTDYCYKNSTDLIAIIGTMAAIHHWFLE